MKTISLLLALTLMTSCGDSIYKGDVEVECYGLINKSEVKVQGVRYEQETGNVVWSVVTFGTIAIPIWLMGWKLYCPIADNNDFSGPAKVSTGE